MVGYACREETGHELGTILAILDLFLSTCISLVKCAPTTYWRGGTALRFGSRIVRLLLCDDEVVTRKPLCFHNRGNHPTRHMLQPHLDRPSSSSSAPRETVQNRHLTSRAYLQPLPVPIAVLSISFQWMADASAYALSCQRSRLRV